MSEFEHVLVATDFGKPAERAEDLGIYFAKAFGAKLTLVFVLSVPDAEYYWQVDEMEARAKKTLEAKATELRKRFAQLTCILRKGVAWEEILTVAKDTGADLIVMGTHGRRGLPRALLGSVAERVVRMATVPVLTVAEPEHEEGALPANGGAQG